MLTQQLELIRLLREGLAALGERVARLEEELDR